MAPYSKMYELTYILTPVLSDDQYNEVVTRINEIIESAGGRIVEVDVWGLRRLAYPVLKKRNGYYVNLYFEGPGAIVARLERALSIDDNVLRYLTLAMDDSMVKHYHRRKAKQEAAEEADAA